MVLLRDTLPRLLASLFLIGLVAATPAAAQSSNPATDFSSLDTRLRDGDRVSITGPEIGTVRGRLVDLAPDLLTVDTDAGVRHISPTQVDRITRTRFGVVLGTIIGAGVGVAFAIPLNMMIANEGGNAVGDTVKLLALTTGIGFGIDAAVNIPRTVYRRDRAPRVRIAPGIRPGGGSVAMQVTF